MRVIRAVISSICALTIVFGSCIFAGGTNRETTAVFSCEVTEVSDYTVALSLSLETNPGIKSALIYIGYEDRLKPDETAVNAEDFGDMQIHSSCSDGILCAEITLPVAQSETGELSSFIFRSEDTIIKGCLFEFNVTAFVKTEKSENYVRAECTHGEYVFIAGVVHIITGDVNGDEMINTADAVIVLWYCSGKTVLTQREEYAADMNSDGKVTTSDAVAILKFTVEH